MSSEAQKQANKRQDVKRRGQPKIDIRLTEEEDLIYKKVKGKHGGSKHDAVIAALTFYLRYK